ARHEAESLTWQYILGKQQHGDACSLSRLIKRVRRTQAAMRDLRAALYALVARHQPVTVRQTFYLAVTAGLIDKTENAYKNTVVRLLADMRRDGELPYG